MSSLAFTFADDNLGSTISISSILVDGLPTPIGETVTHSTKSTISASLFSDNQLLLTVPTSGMYGVTVYSLSGRELLHRNLSFQNGMNKISLDRLGGNRVVLLAIENGGNRFVQKLLLK